MSVMLSMDCGELSEERLRDLAFELMGTLNRDAGLDAELAQHAGEKGGKGDITAGQIVITALTSGTVAALINVLNSYINRKSSLSFDLARGEHRKLTITAENLDKARIDRTMKMVEEFLEKD